MLYKTIELPSEEPVQYVGCYVLKWGKVDQPTLGFAPVGPEDILELLNTVSKICYDLKIETDGPDWYPLDRAWANIRDTIIDLEEFNAT